jgi:poly(beta-D-mannuronate) lyase
MQGRFVVGLAIMLAAGAARADCASVPPAVRDIDANGYYSDSHHSIVDPVRKARNEAAVKPVNDYLDAVSRAANAFQRSRDEAAARCALGWMEAWAGQDALLGTMTTEQSYYTRKWTLAGLALSYARVRPGRRARPARAASTPGCWRWPTPRCAIRMPTRACATTIITGRAWP